MRKRILSFALTIIMALGLAQSSVLAADTSTGGNVPSQDAEGTYLIENDAQLIWFANETNAGRLLDASVKLISDIDLSNISKWKPIADRTRFIGTFDGNGKKISGVSGGLFGYLSTNGVIKNLTAEGYIEAKVATTGAFVLDHEDGLVENCVNKVNMLSSKKYGTVGGISGRLYKGTIKNCVNYGTISIPENPSSNINGIGGIVGEIKDSNCIISGCTNYGDISAYGAAAGILGYSKNNYYFTIADCINYGNVTGVSSASGIVGHLSGVNDTDMCTHIKNSENYGKIVATREDGLVGGIVCDSGGGKSSGYARIENVVNNGILEATTIDGILCKEYEPAQVTYFDCYYLDDGSNNPKGTALSGKASLKEIAAAKDVSAAIEKLGTITLESESAINEVSTAYNALNDVQKALVKNANVIETAKATLEELKKSQVKEPDPQPEPGKPEANPEPEKPAEGVAPSAEAVQEAVNKAKDAVATVDEAASLGLAVETPEVKVPMVSEAGEAATVIPAEVLETVKGKNVDVVFEMGSYTWTVNGTSVTAEEVKALNLSVEKVSDVVPAGVVEGLAQGNPTVQLRLSHEGDFGFKATLRYNFGSEYAGKYANVYWYKADGTTQITTSGLIDSDGYAELAFTHASDYVVVLSNDNKAAEKVLDAEITNNDINVTASPKTGDSASLILMLSLLGLCILAGSAVKSKKEAN